MKSSKNKNKDKAKDKAKKERKQKQRLATQSVRILEQARKNADIDLWVNAYIPGKDGPYEIKDTGGDPRPLFPDVFPGELTLSCWLRKFPKNALENRAAVTILSCDITDHEAVQKASALLAEMQEQGSVIAANTLGIWHMDGTLSKDREKAVSFLSFAAGKGDPVSCYLLSVLLLENEADKEEGLTWLKRSYESKCPSAAASLAFHVQEKDVTLSDDELCSLGKLLAVYAMEGSWRCLKAFLDLVQGNDLPQSRDYVTNVLEKLKDMAKAGFVPAIMYMASFHEKGIFFKKSSLMAARLYKIACDNDKSVIAGIKYARILLAEKNKSKESQESTQDALAVLESCCKQKGCPAEAFGMLGAWLLLHEDNELFSHGAELLEKYLDMGESVYLTHAASTLAMSCVSDEKRQTALRLLDKAAEAKDPHATTLRARLYLHGLPGIPADTKQGMLMLGNATKLGDPQAYATLAEICLFGLYDQPVDIENAYDWAMDGVGQHHDSRCLIWAVLTDFKEFPGWHDGNGSFDEKGLKQMLVLCMGFRDEVILIFTVLNLLNATSSLSRLKKNGTSSRSLSAVRIRSLGQVMGNLCIRLMQRCSMGVLSYLAQALGKIAKTASAERFATAFSEQIGLPQAETCPMLQKRIQAYISGMPKSFEEFLGKGLGIESKNMPLPDFESDVCDVLSDLRFFRN